MTETMHFPPVSVSILFGFIVGLSSAVLFAVLIDIAIPFVVYAMFIILGGVFGLTMNKLLSF